ncbi:MAG: S8 family serine peptidase [Herminiimonas sp.]|nr:S8 family serine peptidase [Herminiimonas sp.]
MNMKNSLYSHLASAKSKVSRTAHSRRFALAVFVATTSVVALLPQARAQGPQSSDESQFAKGRILVEARAGLSPEELDKILKVHGGKSRKLGQSNLHLVTIAPGLEKNIVEKLARNPHLKFAELDRRVSSTFVPNDPYFGSQWHIAKVGADVAWDTAKGNGVTIAILDSGVEAAHPDLAASIVPGFNVYDNNSDTADVCGHGTAVAGTAAASMNNSAGTAGVAGQARIMPVRIAYFDTAAGGCYAYFSTVASGLTYAADHGARVANVSYGGVATSASVLSAAQYLKNKGGLVFISAGNSGLDENVAPTTALIPVSATDGADMKTSWSNYGAFVALAAPGTGIWTTSRGGLYQAWNGTSFSSPLAAGVAALMMSAQPVLDSVQIEKLLFSTAVDLGVAGRDPWYGYGRVNAAAGVNAAVATIPVVDMQAPTASVSAPLANASVSGLVPVTPVVADNIGVVRVELRTNGTVVAVDSSAPFGFSWDSKGVVNGMVTLAVTAYDAAGNMTTSAPVSVTVANSVAPVVPDTVAPVVSIANPVAGKVSGNVAIAVNATDNSGSAGISQVLYIDGQIKARGNGGALAYNWNSRKASTGLHVIKAVATDAAGNSATTSVQVSN